MLATHDDHYHMHYIHNLCRGFGMIGALQHQVSTKVSFFQRYFCTLSYVAVTMDSVLIRKASLFQRSLIEICHCNTLGACLPVVLVSKWY